MTDGGGFYGGVRSYLPDGALQRFWVFTVLWLIAHSRGNHEPSLVVQ